MKVIAAVLLLVSLAAAEYVVKSQEDLQQIRQECIAELKVPAELVEQYKKWEYPNDSVTQCYLKCVFNKFGLFDTQAGFNIENIQAQLTNGDAAQSIDNLRQTIDTCFDKNEQGSNACEWAYRGATCFFKQNLPLVKQSVKPKA